MYAGSLSGTRTRIPGIPLYKQAALRPVAYEAGVDMQHAHFQLKRNRAMRAKKLYSFATHEPEVILHPDERFQSLASTEALLPTRPLKDRF